MFKRLFIGLLILSALTSEGAVAFPGNIYRSFFKLDSALNLAEEKASAEVEIPQGEPIDAFSIDASFYNAVLLSEESIKKVFCFHIPLDYPGGMNDSYISSSSAGSLPIAPVISESRSMFTKADVSPPKA